MLKLQETEKKLGMPFPDMEDIGDYKDSHIADLISTLGVNTVIGITEHEVGDSGIYIETKETGNKGEAGIEDLKTAAMEFLRIAKKALPWMGHAYKSLYEFYLTDYEKYGLVMPMYGRIL